MNPTSAHVCRPDSATVHPWMPPTSRCRDVSAWAWAGARWRFTDSYPAADVRIGYSSSDGWTLSVTGRNLFTGLHHELNTTNSLNEFIRPSYAVKLTWLY